MCNHSVGDPCAVGDCCLLVDTVAAGDFHVLHFCRVPACATPRPSTCLAPAVAAPCLTCKKSQSRSGRKLDTCQVRLRADAAVGGQGAGAQQVSEQIRQETGHWPGEG
jgi:hypothetical protein